MQRREENNFMKVAHSLVAVAFIAFAGCSTMHQAAEVKENSETVLITYHVQAGKEAEFQKVLLHAWTVYQNEHYVSSQPHVIVKDADDADKTRFTEIFTWIKPPDHAPDSIKAVWKQEQSLCEARKGHATIEGGEVQLITTK
jgi:hypothetical protein